jgi:hypothetical protein
VSEKLKKRPIRKELGGTGRAFSQNVQARLATDEYLSTLSFPNDISIYNKMARSDGQVKAILLMLSLPIRATQWFVRPKDTSPKAIEISNFVQDNLFGGYNVGLNTGFDDFIKNITTMFQYGFSIFEKVFEVKEGKLKYKKFAVRPQSTIYDIFYDEVGDCSGIEQYLIKSNWQTVNIPIEKLLFFSHDMQQGNVRGSSVLRTAYKHWYIKDFLYKIVNIGIERNFVGTPVLTLPEGYTEADLELADEIVATLRSHEFGGVRIPANFILEMFEGKRTLADVQPYIDHQDDMIAKCILSQFMNLGTGSNSGGSFALSGDQSQLFLMMLDSSAKNIANVINTHCIPELVSYNFSSDLYPTLAFKPMNSSKIINTLKTLVDGKIVLPDDDLETYIRDMLDFPAANPVKTREEMAEQFEQNQKIKLETDKDSNLKTENKKNPDMTKSKTPIETGSKQAQYKDKIKDDSITKKMAENISEDNFHTLIDIIEKQVISLKEKSKGMDLENISSIKVQHKGELTKFIGHVFINDLKLSENDDKYLAKCKVVSNNISELVKSIFLTEIIDNHDIDIQEIVQKIIMKL